MMEITSKIKQRRLQMLVHSYLYYEMDNNIIDDATWSKWAKELAELQQKYPKEASEVEYANLFEDWDGSTGTHLVYDERIINKAHYLLRLKNEQTNKVLFKQTREESGKDSKRKTDSKLRSKRLF